MNLEQRVEVVEQELNLIKAQIQEILLQIQEQLLKEAHPVLRAEENHKAATRAPEVEHTPKPSATPAARTNGTAPTPTYSENHNGSGRPAPSREYPQAKQFNADTFAEQPVNPQPAAERPANRQPVDRRPAPAAAAPTYNPPAQPPARSNGHYASNGNNGNNANNANNGRKPAATAFEPAEVKVWIQLDQWVSQKVREMGVARTRSLINLCDEPERSLLTQFIDVYDERGPQPSAPNQPFAASYANQPPQNQPYPAEPMPYNNARPYNPSGERQDLMLRLITALLDDAQRPPYLPNNNGYGNH